MLVRGAGHGRAAEAGVVVQPVDLLHGTVPGGFDDDEDVGVGLDDVVDADFEVVDEED